MPPSPWPFQPCADAFQRAKSQAGYRPITRGAVAAVVLVALVAPLAAQERLVRTFGPENGLSAPPVWGLAQDSTGFLWIATEGGLFRFDGVEFRRWAADSIMGRVHSVTVSPSGQIAAVEINGRAFEITPFGARSISPSVRQPWSFNALTYDQRGTLWL